MSGPAPKSGSIYYSDWLDITVRYGGERMIMAEISVDMLRTHESPTVEVRVTGTWYDVRDIKLNTSTLVAAKDFHVLDISFENEQFRKIANKGFRVDGIKFYFSDESLVMVHISQLGGSIRIDRDDNKIIDFPSQRSESPIEQILGPPTKMDVPGLNR